MDEPFVALSGLPVSPMDSKHYSRFKHLLCNTLNILNDFIFRMVAKFSSKIWECEIKSCTSQMRVVSHGIEWQNCVSRLGIMSIKWLCKSKPLLVLLANIYLVHLMKIQIWIKIILSIPFIIQNNVIVMSVISMNALGVLVSKIEMSSLLKWLCFTFSKLLLSFILSTLHQVSIALN